MSLFNESIESIAQAIVTVKRALKAGVIEQENYKELNAYLNRRAVDFKVKKSHIAKAKRDFDDELKSEVEEFFMDKGDALYKMAEEILEDFGGNENAVDDKAAAAWANMTNAERMAMAKLASDWLTSR
jgi:hypothetical protein